MKTRIPARVGALALVILIAAMTASSAGARQTPDGRWSGAIQIQGTELAINVDMDAAAQTAKIDIPPQGAFGLGLKNVRLSADSVHFELPAGPGLAIFDATDITSTRVSGTFRQGSASGAFFLEPAPEDDQPAEVHAPEREVSVQVDGGMLYGALASPEGATDLVIVHAGSGPTTRDGNTQGTPTRNNSLLLLSDALFEGGVAVLRFDKRGVGPSAAAAPPEADLRFDTFVNDLVAWVEQMRTTGSYENIILAGHSEGALITTLAAVRTEVDALILVAGVGRLASAVLREQLSRNLPPALYAESDSIIAALEAGDQVDDVSGDLAALFRPSVQPYLISWFSIDPAEALAEVSAPTLVIQGTTDIQVSVADAERLAEARPDAELILIDGMNHVLKDVSGDLAAQLPSYGDPKLPINSELPKAILEFVGMLEK